MSGVDIFATVFLFGVPVVADVLLLGLAVWAIAYRVRARRAPSA